MRYVKEFYNFFMHLIQSRSLLWTLVLNDFKRQYLGSYFGLLWAFVQPLTFMFIIWFVFELGFRSSPTSGDFPFFLWLMCGMIPWLFFSSAVLGGAESVVSNSFLVKKVAFRVSVLPLVKIGSALIIHLVFLMILIFLFIAYGYSPSIYWLQLPFFIACFLLLLLGISWLTASIRVFVKDVSNSITIIVQMGFWFTPVFWSPDIIPCEYQYLLQMNPMHFIINGYRASLVDHIWFWSNYEDVSIFLGIVSFFLIAGVFAFKRLRPHFADVL